MVKIKEGYVMSASEKAEFERQDALPRRISGKVDYYFKPETKYPARIYVFMQAELWCDRNRRPMGLYNAFPFLSRPMNKEELEYHHFNWRLCYHQYERWDRLLAAEQREADELDREQPGAGAAFMEKLHSFRSGYTLADGLPPRAAIVQSDIELPPPTEIDLKAEEAPLLIRLAAGSGLFPAEVVSTALEAEQHGAKRKTIILALRYLYRQAAGEISPDKKLNRDTIIKRAASAEKRSRCNFVRRCWSQNPLFALTEIRSRYPAYTERMLLDDLRVKSRKVKRKKHKPVTDLRRCQLVKLVALLKNGQLTAA